MNDIIIIGGGPGGYSAAIRGAQLGARICLIEKKSLGGTCLNKGCIPTKSFYKSAEMIRDIKKSDNYGIEIEKFKINSQKIYKRKDQIIEQLRAGIEILLKQNKIEVIYGEAYFKNENTVVIKETQQEIRGKHIVIATGSKVKKLEIQGIELAGVMTTDDLLETELLPRKMAIIGGGVVGVEFANIFNEFGVEIVILEFLPKILDSMDQQIVKRLMALMKKRGIKIITSAKVKKIEKSEALKITYEDDLGMQILEADQVLLSTGRQANFEKLNLEKIGVAFNKKGIIVNGQLETSGKNIYAIGDVNGIWMLAHAASYQGIQVVEKIMEDQAIKLDNIVPNCIFAFPEIASAGIREEDIKEEKENYKVGKFMFKSNGKALASGEPDGFVKVIADREGYIKGVHIIGPHASDLIHEGAMAIKFKLKIEAMKKMIFAHPTLSEAFFEAVLSVDQSSIHGVNK